MAAQEAREERIDQIRRAAIGVFAANGFKGSSMAKLAAAAGVSRPALYQYFDNREDLFRAALEAFLDDATDRALDALAVEGTIPDRLDGYLQRATADGYEALISTPHGEEILDAQMAFAQDVADVARRRAEAGLRDFVERSADAVPAVVRTVIDLLILAPGGLKSDGPDVATYRSRLTGLARAAAGMLAMPHR